MKKSYILNLNEIDTVVDEILSHIKNGVVLLKGDLASGKTTLVKAVAKKLGCEDDVTSPTFSLQQCYGQNIFHYDIYNHGFEHFISLGMAEELEKDGLHFVEWADDELKEFLDSVGIEFLEIDIKKLENKREYTICTH